MSASAGPDLIQNGLQLMLDAGNFKSYSGVGTVWKDLSGFNRDFNIPSGMITNFNRRGYFFLPAGNANGQAASQSTLNLGATNITVSVWIRVYTHGDWNNFVRNNWVNTGWLLYASSSSWIFGCARNGTQFNASIIHNNTRNQWVNLVGVYNSVVPALYVNTVRNTNTISGSPANINLDVNRTIFIGNTGNPGGVDIANVMVYNRALSQDEVNQNFKVLRSKFNPLAGV